jgi:uncharacterized UPF0160 family protein
MALFSCDDIDDGLQNQAQVAKSLDFSVAIYFIKIKKSADHHDTQEYHTALHLSKQNDVCNTVTQTVMSFTQPQCVHALKQENM